MSYLDNLFGVTGKTAVVTGAATGIGRMMAEALVRAGARVLIASRKGADCANVAAELTAIGPGSAEGFVGDVGTGEGVAALTAEIDAGAVVASYLGHGSINVWASETMLCPMRRITARSLSVLESLRAQG